MYIGVYFDISAENQIYRRFFPYIGENSNISAFSCFYRRNEKDALSRTRKGILLLSIFLIKIDQIGRQNFGIFLILLVGFVVLLLERLFH
jgi:hypothetical protein